MRDVINRAACGDYSGWLDHIRAAAGCTRPIRLAGQVHTIDPATGQIIAATDTASMPDGVIYKACGNRRATVCPSCSTVYQYDAYQLLRAGLAGGKQIPESVSSHPAVFATFTAPSFGAVHSRVVTDAHLPRPDTLPMPTAALPHPPQPRHLRPRPASGLLHPAPRRRPGAR